MGRNGDDAAESSLGLDDDALSSSRYSFRRASLMDEWASQNSCNRAGCVKEEMLQRFPVAAAVSIEQVDVLEKLVERLRTVVAVLRCHK